MPNHVLEYFSNSYKLPISEILGNEILSFPLHAELTDIEQKIVISETLKYLAEQ
jgi:dTDP-4-amino-4,6-dideoxygalactose transaminase